MLTHSRNALLLFVAVPLVAFAVVRGYMGLRAERAAPVVGFRITSDTVAGAHCPELTSWVVSPLRTSVGGWIDVAVAARDVDPGRVMTFSWEPAQNFDPAHAQKSRFRCQDAGKQEVRCTVSDNRRPVPCATRLSVPVECVAR
jgi:hypothetical protein